MSDADTGTDANLCTRRVDKDAPPLRSADRLALQDYDTGAPDDTVYTVDTHTSRCYHASTACSSLNTPREDCTPMARREAQRKWLGPCRACADLVAPAEVGDNE